MENGNTLKQHCSLVSRLLNLRMAILLALCFLHVGCETVPPALPWFPPSSVTLVQASGKVNLFRQGRSLPIYAFGNWR